MKLKSEFDNLVSKIKIPGSEVSFARQFSYVIHFFLKGISLNTKEIVDGVGRRRMKLNICSKIKN